MGGATYNSNPTAWKQQTQKYCGLEAKVTDPTTGKTSLLYIGDSFDDRYVHVSFELHQAKQVEYLLTRSATVGERLDRYHDRCVLKPPRQP